MPCVKAPAKRDTARTQRKGGLSSALALDAETRTRCRPKGRAGLAFTLDPGCGVFRCPYFVRSSFIHPAGSFLYMAEGGNSRRRTPVTSGKCGRDGKKGDAAVRLYICCVTRTGSATGSTGTTALLLTSCVYIGSCLIACLLGLVSSHPILDTTIIHRGSATCCGYTRDHAVVLLEAFAGVSTTGRPTGGPLLQVLRTKTRRRGRVEDKRARGKDGDEQLTSSWRLCLWSCPFPRHGVSFQLLSRLCLVRLCICTCVWLKIIVCARGLA